MPSFQVSRKVLREDARLRTQEEQSVDPDIRDIFDQYKTADSSASELVFVAPRRVQLSMVLDIGRLGAAAQYVRLDCTECAHERTCSGSTCRRMN